MADGFLVLQPQVVIVLVGPEDPDRLADAGVPDDIEFATKPRQPPGC